MSKPNMPKGAKVKEVIISTCQVHFKTGQGFNFGEYNLDTIALMNDHKSEQIVTDIYVDGEFVFKQKAVAFVQMFCIYWQQENNRFDSNNKEVISKMLAWEKSKNLFQPMKATSYMPPKTNMKKLN